MNYKLLVLQTASPNQHEPDEYHSADLSHLAWRHALKGVYASWKHLCSGDCWLSTRHLTTLTTARIVFDVGGVQTTVMQSSPLWV